MALVLRTTPERVVYVGFKRKDGVVCTNDLASGEEFTGTVTVTIEGGAGVSLVAASAAILTTNATNDTIGAMFEATAAGQWTITFTCETTTGEVKGGFVIWNVQAVPTS